MRIIILFSMLLCAPFFALAQQAGTATPVTGQGVTGTVLRHEKFASKYVDARNVDVWLPPGYEREKGKRYPVVYMHDGQNLFDPKSSYIGVDWGVDETMTRLVNEKKVRPAVIVGIWNTPKRGPEYMPQKAAERMDEKGWAEYDKATGGVRPVSDQYLKFIVEELKPFIDANYRTRAGRGHTFVMGSSMGGLISAYAVSEYPEVFGGAGAVSTHWPIGDGVVIEFLKTRLPDPRTHKLYFDFGTATLDAQYEPYQQRMDALVRSRGYKEGKNWLTRKFEGDEHSERAWSRRLWIPLTFLLGK